MKKTRRQVSKVQYRFGSPLDFLFDRPPYDPTVRDCWACQSFLDLEKEIQVFRSSGYSDPEIEDLYTKARESAERSWNLSATLDLPKPVRILVTLGE